MAKVMVLAAGHGTRLKVLTTELPKPLLPVGSQPMLRHILDYLAARGVDQVVVNTHHLPHCFDEFDPGSVQLTRVHEPELLGTAGGVAGAREYLEDQCVVWNSDIFAEPPIAELLLAARAAPLTLLVAEPALPRGHGSVGLDHNGCVVRLRGETFGEETAGANYVGLAALGAEVMRQLPPQGCLVGDVCLPRLRQGRAIETLTHTGPWSDIGTPSAYLQLNRDWLRQAGQPSLVAKEALVAAGVELVESVVGAGARISGAGTLERCVVWPGAQARAPLVNTVVLTSGRLVQVE